MSASNSSVGQLESAAIKRKARLAQLKAKRAKTQTQGEGDGEGAGDREDKDTLPQ